MKNTFLMLFLAAISINTVSGQKVNIQMKGGFLSSKIDYSWETPVKNEGYSGELRPTFALSIDGQIYKGLYVGAELGTCSYLERMNFSYTQPFDPYTVTTNYSGWYKQEQVYATFNTQYWFGSYKFLGVGCSIGIYNNYVNAFSSGSTSDKSTSPNWQSSNRNLDGKDYLQPNTTVGGFINAIVNPKFNHIGLVAEVRYIFNDYTHGQITQTKPDIRFNSLAILTGLSFHF